MLAEGGTGGADVLLREAGEGEGGTERIERSKGMVQVGSGRQGKGKEGRKG